MAQDLTIGIICEGPTDGIVLRSIITSFTGNKDIVFTPLQPLPGTSGNWDKVFKYCASQDFREAFRNPDAFVVIQVDTDFLRGDSVPEHLRIPAIGELQPLQLAAAVRRLMTAAMDESFFAAVSHRILFAIAVDRIECWLLAIYYPEKAKAAKHINCLDNLNKKLASAEGFTISGKEDRYYETICKRFKKRDDLLRYSQPNESFKAFIEELSEKLPAGVVDDKRVSWQHR